MRDYYKIVDYEDGKLKTLFHGVNGKREIELNTWLKSVQKVVSDGTSGTKYISGWHVLPSYGECVDYLRKFTNLEPKKIVKCHIKNSWPKSHSRSNVLLAEHMKVLEILDWKV